MKKVLTALAAAAALLGTGHAMAQAYVGGAIGFSQLDGACDDIGDSCDDEDTGFKVFGGYKFTPNFALEANYIHFGEATASGFGLSGEVEGTSLGLGVAGFFDFTPSLTGVARVGFASNKADATVRGPGFSSSDDASKTKPYFGVALGYKLMPNLTIEGGVDFTTFEYEDGEADARLISVGLRYNF